MERPRALLPADSPALRKEKKKKKNNKKRKFQPDSFGEVNKVRQRGQILFTWDRMGLRSPCWERDVLAPLGAPTKGAPQGHFARSQAAQARGQIPKFRIPPAAAGAHPRPPTAEDPTRPRSPSPRGSPGGRAAHRPLPDAD